eukprot:40411_1
MSTNSNCAINNETVNKQQNLIYSQNKCDNDFSECRACQQIKFVLGQYHKILQHNNTQKQLQVLVDQLFHDAYPILQLLNDFDHVKHNHQVDNEDSQFYLFSDYLSEVFAYCDIKTCKSIHRHYSRREKFITNQQITHNYNLDLLSRIHTYFIHSQQTNRLTKKK